MELSFIRIIELLKKSNKIVITGHMNPDGDCLGSMLALYFYLLHMGKNVQVVLDDDIPVLYNFLPGVHDISKPNTFMDVDLLIVLDASDTERIGHIRDFVKAPILNIDHHISNTKYADYYYIDSICAATAQIIMDLIEADQCVIDEKMAICLYTGIATDCGFFRYANTTAVTMYKAAKLLELGVKPQQISEAMETKSLNSVLALTQVLDTLEFFADGRIATITVDQNNDEDLDTEGFINYPRNISGVEIAILFKFDQEMVRVSLRSRQANVSQLALSFGGGGHQRAAGCSVIGPISEVKKQVIQVAIEQLKELPV